MSKVRIEIYEDGAPSATISVPAWMLTGAASLLTKVAAGRLQDRVDLAAIAQALRNPEAVGRLIEVEDHAAGDRIVVSIVDDRPDGDR